MSSPGIESMVTSAIDKYLPITPQKCSLFSCTPGQIWLALAILATIGSANAGWAILIGTIIWQVVLSILAMWMCRACHNNWIWMLPVALSFVPMIFALSRRH